MSLPWKKRWKAAQYSLCKTRLTLWALVVLCLNVIKTFKTILQCSKSLWNKKNLKGSSKTFVVQWMQSDSGWKTNHDCSHVSDYFSVWFSDPAELDLVLVIVSLAVGSSLVTVTLLLVWLAYRRRAIWLLHSAAPPRACCGCLRPGDDLILPWPRRNHCQLHWSRPHQNSCRQLH